MTAPLLFMPARASTEELEQTFVGRWNTLKELEKALLDDARRHTTRHFQIIAPRGSGKSHLTQLLGRLLERDHGWNVVALPEEHYQVASVGELLEQIVIRLERLSHSPFSEARVTDVEDLALDRLRQWRAKNTGPLLVVLENLGTLLERKLTSRREQQRLRQILSTDPPFVLLTTATSQIDALVQHDAPFYDFFQPTPLDDLSRDDVAALVDARAKWDREDALLAHPSAVHARLNAIYHFSGGNPRLVLDLYSVLRRGVTQDMHAQLLRLLDEVTPYYQSRLQDISPQMARILTEMALADGNLTPSEVAVRCRMATNHVTASLTRLERERLVRPVGRPDRRRRYYEVSDRLLRLWMQVRETPSARARLRPLVEFFRRWYERNQDEMDESAANVAHAFWRDLGSGTTAVSCGDKLETLAYLEEAAGPGEEGSLSLSALYDASHPAEDRNQRLGHLSDLFEKSSDPDHKARVGYLLSIELSRLGQMERALSTIQSVVDRAVGGVNTFVWREYLELLRRVKGEDQSFDAGLQAIASHPSLWPLKRDMATTAAWRGDSNHAWDFTEGFLEKAQCAHCKTEVVFRVAWQAAMRGHADISRRVLDSPKLIALLSDSAQAALRILLRSEETRPSSTDLLRALEEWKAPKDVPIWIVWQVACRLSHQPRWSAEAYRYLVEFVDRKEVPTPSVATHALLTLVGAYVHKNDQLAGEIVEWIARTFQPTLLKASFLEDMISHSRERGICVLRAYEALRDRNLIQEDLVPFSAALRVSKATDPAPELAALHPEMREAVELLLKKDPVASISPRAGLPPVYPFDEHRR